MRYYISDLHFCHSNLNQRMDRRGFESGEAMNEHMKQIEQYRRNVHGISEKVSIPCQMINCFCMFSDYIPLTLDEWIQLDKKRRAKITLSDYDGTDNKWCFWKI